MGSWQDNNVTSFKDQFGTIFTKGPFQMDSGKYDYMLEDDDGIDYCTIEQMIAWKIELAEDLTK